MGAMKTRSVAQLFAWAGAIALLMAMLVVVVIARTTSSAVIAVVPSLASLALALAVSHSESVEYRLMASAAGAGLTFTVALLGLFTFGAFVVPALVLWAASVWSLRKTASWQVLVSGLTLGFVIATAVGYAAVALRNTHT